MGRNMGHLSSHSDMFSRKWYKHDALLVYTNGNIGRHERNNDYHSLSLDITMCPPEYPKHKPEPTLDSSLSHLQVKNSSDLHGTDAACLPSQGHHRREILKSRTGHIDASEDRPHIKPATQNELFAKPSSAYPLDQQAHPRD